MLNKKEALKAFIKAEEEKIKQLKISLERTQQDARESPGSNVSHSDTMKFQFSNLALGIQKRISEAQETLILLKKIDLYETKGEIVTGGSLISLKNTDTEEIITYLIVPDRGGESVEINGQKVISISIATPLVYEIRGKKKGDEICFREKNFEVIGVQ